MQYASKRNILIFFLQAVCIRVMSILMALSSVMTKTPVVCVTVTEEMSPAPGYRVMQTAAILTNHPGNAVENANVSIMKI